MTFVKSVRFIAAALLIIILGLIAVDCSRKVADIPDARIQAKLVLFNPVKDSVNLFFIGSSLVGLNIDGELFDSITGFRSFNFGAGGMILNTKIDFLNELIDENYIKSGSTVIFEAGLQPVFNLKNFNKKKFRYPAYANYLKSTSSFINDLKYCSYQGVSRSAYFSALSYHVSRYFSSRNKFEAKSKFNIKSPNKAISALSHKGKVKVSAKTGSLMYVDKHKDTFEESEYPNLYARARKVCQINDSIKNLNGIDQSILNYYHKLQADCSKKGIKLIVLIPFLGPSFGEPFGVAWEPILALKSNTQLVMDPDFENHESFVIEEMIYDLRHLNPAGQRAYTKLLADKFMLQFPSNGTNFQSPE